MGFPFEYALTDSALEIRVAGRPIRRAAYSNIEYAKRGWTFWQEKWINWWPPFVGRMVIVRRRDAWIKNMVINPDDPEDFLRDLRGRGVEIK